MEVQRYEWHEVGHEPSPKGGWVSYDDHKEAVQEARLEPQAGVMHPVDKAFYDLTVKERDKAWRDLTAAVKRIRELEGK